MSASTCIMLELNLNHVYFLLRISHVNDLVNTRMLIYCFFVVVVLILIFVAIVIIFNQSLGMKSRGMSILTEL